MELFYSLYQNISSRTVEKNPFSYENITRIPIYNSKISSLDNFEHQEKYLEFEIPTNNNSNKPGEPGEPCEVDNSLSTLSDFTESKQIPTLPIGTWYSGICSLEWTRIGPDSDYNVNFKGKFYTINYLVIEKIYSQTNSNIDEILKLYILNDFDETATLCYLLV